MGHVDPSERQFVHEDQGRVKYRIDTLPLRADSLEELRGELMRRCRDIVSLAGDQAAVSDGARRVGRVYGDRLLLLGDHNAGQRARSATCRHWNFREETLVWEDEQAEPAIIRTGSCRRWSPHPRHGWPKTNDADWCGEHDPGTAGADDRRRAPST